MTQDRKHFPCFLKPAEASPFLRLCNAYSHQLHGGALKNQLETMSFSAYFSVSLDISSLLFEEKYKV